MAATPVDIAVLTAKVEEFTAFKNRLVAPELVPGTRESPNQYAWTMGRIEAARGNGDYRVVVGLTQEQTNVPAAIAALETFGASHPRYLVFMGIAGSIDPSLRQGDVYCAEYIKGFEYGVITETGKFQPRGQFQTMTDGTLFTNAIAFGDSQEWKTIAGVKPGTNDQYSRLQTGGLASGDKVIEDVHNEFFAPVREGDDWLRAVDMESAGMALAVRKLNEKGNAVGLMVVRGISDAPGDPQVTAEPREGANRLGRAAWTAYASGAASAFLEQFIKHAFPFAPASYEQFDPNALVEEPPYRSALATGGDLQKIHALNDEIFRATDLVPKATLETWWGANPQTIGLVETSAGEPMAYWQVLLLTPPAFEDLLVGRLVEKQIDASHLQQFQQLTPGAVHVYITAVAARPAQKLASTAVVLDLISFLALMHEHIGIDAIAAQTVTNAPVGIVTKYRMSRVAGNAPLPTWVVRPKNEVGLAMSQAERTYERLRHRAPDFSADDRQTLIDLLQR